LKKELVFWVEEYFYNPNTIQKIISFLLLPISLLYCFVMWLRFKLSKAEDFGVKIISIGNLNVGGNGKTPLVIALASKVENVAIILRGYGRDSKGMLVVKDKSGILCSVDQSGDEAMIYAKKLSHAVVIVSEDRKIAIKKAKEMGIETIFLDDAYSKHDILKEDLIIQTESKNSFCLPSGAFRERLWSGKKAKILREDVDFKRVVKVVDATPKMALVTAIARPQRLDKYLPDLISKHYFEDHHNFTKEELQKILKDSNATSLLVTFKDYVKIEDFNLPLSLLDLEIVLL